MERARLIVKNFGPLKDIDIEVREMVAFIGAQASGKSTLAKLLSIFEDEGFRNNELNPFVLDLINYGISSYLKPDTHIEFICKDYVFSYKNLEGLKLIKRKLIQNSLFGVFFNNKKEKIDSLIIELIEFELKSNGNQDIEKSNIIFNQVKETFKVLHSSYDSNYDKLMEILYKTLSSFIVTNKSDSIYIPTERSFLHLIAENTIGLINNNVQIPKHLLNAGQEYEKAIQTIKELPLSIIDKKIKYKREGKTSYIYHNQTEKVNLLESASGLQSIIPILLLVEYSKSLKDKYNFNFVVEEPELNLYPKAQHELIKYLVKNCLLDRKNLILTTHSPFVLASINNLLLAFDKGKTKPAEVNKIIKKESWLDPKNFIAYELKNGKAKKIMNDKLGQINENMIDIVSDSFSDEFDKLLNL
jgi:predicted ATPase